MCLALAVAQPAQGQLATASPEQAAQTLAACKDNECSQFTKLVGLDFPLDSECQINSVRSPLEQGSTEAILEVGCHNSFALILLRQQARDRWVSINSISLIDGEHSGNLETTLVNLSSAETKDIVVQHVVTGYGTGFLDENFLVLKVVDGRLHTVLDTMQRFVRADWPAPHLVEGKSAFKLEPPSQGEPGDICEDETITSHGNPTVSLRQRYFYWNKNLQIFEPSGWNDVTVVLRHQPLAKKQLIRAKRSGAGNWSVALWWCPSPREWCVMFGYLDLQFPELVIQLRLFRKTKFPPFAFTAADRTCRPASESSLASGISARRFL